MDDVELATRLAVQVLHGLTPARTLHVAVGQTRRVLHLRTSDGARIVVAFAVEGRHRVRLRAIHRHMTGSASGAATARIPRLETLASWGVSGPEAAALGADAAHWRATPDAAWQHLAEHDEV